MIALTYQEARECLAALDQMILEYPARPAELTAMQKLWDYLQTEPRTEDSK